MENNTIKKDGVEMKLIGGENQKLKTKCEFTDIKKAVKVGNKLKKFVNGNGCLGLAANQFGILERVCIAKVGSGFKVFINPEITRRQGKQISEQEGCLTYPNIRGDIKRPQSIRVSWLSVGDKGFETTERVAWFDDLDAIVLEHEIDHLDGIRCVDKMYNKKYRGMK